MEIVVPDEYRYLYELTWTPPVVKYPAEVLRRRALPVAKFSKRTIRLIGDMIRIMRDANGQGLAAPQVGVSERVVIIAPGGGKAMPLVNPTILEAIGEQVGQEGCLSIPGLYGDVKRSQRVVVRALDGRGKVGEWEMEGLAARVVLHEIDHLDGVLFTDRVDPATLYWQNPDPDTEE